MSCNTTVIRPYQWDKPLKQGKLDRYSIDLTDWLGEDDLGTVVATSTNTNYVDVRNLNTGFYLVAVYSGDKKSIKKIIVK